jgi:type II secretory ATPase GspE/PulE/Tfp pilus assembly ATPase PilB-like protein
MDSKSEIIKPTPSDQPAQGAPAAVIEWPIPPYSTFEDHDRLGSPEPCIVHMRTGAKLHGTLIRFFPDEQRLRFSPEQGGAVLTIPFGSIRTLRMEHPLALRREITSLEGRAQEMFAPSERQTYKVEFEDNQIMAGETVGYVTAACGLFLYLPENDGKVVRWFFPFQATKKQEIGRPIGEQLIAQNAASLAEIDAALAYQQELRAQRIGDVLTANQIVSRDQLKSAIEHQKSMPVLKLGEALMQIGLLTQAQLDAALEMQHRNRKMPLGRILVKMGVVDERTLNDALAKRLGIPFVSLKKFNFDPEAIALIDYAFARKHVLIPLCLSNGSLVVAFENPLANAVTDELRFITQHHIIPAVASHSEIKDAIDEQYSTFGSKQFSEESEEVDRGRDEYEYHKSMDMHVDELAARLAIEDEALEVEVTQVPESDSTLVQLVNKMILDAYSSGVSDIHIESFPGKQNTRVRFRKDGTLSTYHDVPASYRNAFVSRIKVMAHLDITNRRKPQDGKIDFKQFGPANIELRIVTIPTANGLEDIVMRVLAASKLVPIDELGLAADSLATLKRLAQTPYGLILVCGPTGSGKTTTLHSLLGHINTPDRKIWTVEDPVEITQPGLRQVQVNAGIGWTFAAAMRSFLRADPDVIVLGEMRDEETASVGIEASLTGHLVLSTLHTNGALESAVRLLDMGMDPFNFADALLGILAQRLAKGLCEHCKQVYRPDEDEIRLLAAEYCDGTHLDPQAVIGQWRNEAAQAGEISLWRATGCEHCNHTGYRGRIGLHELMVVTPPLRRMIQTRAPLGEMQVEARAEGMRTLKQDGIAKVLLGRTDITQIRAVCA